jgi:hypothetical protein
MAVMLMAAVRTVAMGRMACVLVLCSMLSTHAIVWCHCCTCRLLHVVPPCFEGRMALWRIDQETGMLDCGQST